MKWGTLYGPDYVNVLYAASRRNLAGDFRFICLTDDASGLRPEVECHPIPDRGLGRDYYGRGGWPKLLLHEKALAGLEGRGLFIDLDSVITGPLDPLFEEPGGIVMIREWRRFADYFRRWQVNGATGVFAWDIGAQAHVAENFLADPAAVRAAFRSEQRFVTAHARDIRFWRHPQVISFKRHLMPPVPLDRLLAVREPPPGTAIIAFHGEPRPIDVVPDRGQRWARGLRYGRGAVPFIRRYWLENGGTDP
jgi:hypothetical protein